MRKIFLPSLKNIKIKNYTLYPNGLDFNFDFVNGVNLVLGGNGMGKTTFVNIIKYAVIGNYKKSFDYTRTYKERLIEKRTLNPSDFFRNRMDKTLILEKKATVTITFLIGETNFTLERCLESIALNSLFINEQKIDGIIITQDKYELIKDEEDKKKYLLYKYEKEIEKYSDLSFDDLIFFVNQILFFGEDHKTILWNDGSLIDTQDELFNKYFNSPELDRERQEALRLSRYYDSLSRHRSEDIRAIKKVLDKVNKSDINEDDINLKILRFKTEIEKLDSQIDKLQEKRLIKSKSISIIQNRINELSLSMNDLETKKNIAETKFVSKVWQTLHPQYEIFLKNIKSNNICPICNKPDDDLTGRVLQHPNQCFACGKKFERVEDVELEKEYKAITEEYNISHKQIQNALREINTLDGETSDLDKEFRSLGIQKRSLQNSLRKFEFEGSKREDTDQLQAFYDEIEKLEIEKSDYQEMSKIESAKAEKISMTIEEHIVKNATKFSSIFSVFAEKFLGVECSLTFDNLEGEDRRFYPVIDKVPRRSPEELSESQRFFIDHSFRMSILSFFYTKPTFYIVETPDSSLDISYEKNAANVFLNFLSKPNILIITSNLNNSLFMNHIIDNKSDIPVSLVGLLDIAKQSIIQNTSETLLNIYQSLKGKIIKNNE